MTNLRIVFAGTPEFGLPSLGAIHSSHHKLLAVYTQPDRPAGRGRKLQSSAIKNWALTQQIPVYQPLNFKDCKSVATLSQLNPDILVVIAYGLILPKSVLSIPKFGCINVHASLLPRWRGASPIQSAILHGDKESGITIMQMNTQMDTGDIITAISCPIDPDETAHTLHNKLAQIATQPLLSTLNNLAEQPISSKPQDNNLATYAGKIHKNDAKINWYNSAKSIDRLIRAFNPWPIAYTEVNETIVRIHQAVIEPISNIFINTAIPGTVLSLDKMGLLIGTGDQNLRIQRIQLAGGRIISFADYLNSGSTQLLNVGAIYRS